MSVGPFTTARDDRAGGIGRIDSRSPGAGRGAIPAPFSPLAIDVDRCKGCGLCVAACPSGVLALDTERVNRLGYHPVELLDPAGCSSCVRCARVCPDAVFTIWAPAREA